jgi:metal-responsive CopG/Arc/MetJ family transcriptional regulator
VNALWSRLLNVETIHIALDKKLLQSADRAAKRSRISRSALIRDALQEHLKRLRARELESREQRGYTRHPDAASEVEYWERAAAWPPER